MSNIYTGKGDLGFTLLPRRKNKISKSDLVFDVLGTFDELNSCLGFLHSARVPDIRKVSVEVQKDLLGLGAIISLDEKITDEMTQKWEVRIKELEEVIDYFDSRNNKLEHFILPGGCRESSFLHLSRAVCRRLERLVIYYLRRNKDKGFVIVYLNRLSDLLFVLARYSNKKLGFEDIIWNNIHS